MRAFKSILFLMASFGAAHAALTTDTLPGVQFGKTVFSPGDQSSEPALFLAASKAIAEPATGAKDIRPYALSRVALSGDSATISPMATDVNGEGESGISISGKKITNVDLLNKKYPVLTIDGDENSAKIIAVMDPYSGGKRLEATVKDCSEPALDIDKPIAGLTASDKYIFVAVPKAGASFEKGTENGIAVIKWDETADILTTLDATDLQAAALTGKAAYLDVSPNGGYVSFTDDAEVSPIAGALIGKTTAMCWDDVLQRLYIGFSYATRDSVNNNGGIFGVAMGLIDKDLTTQKDKVFKLYPVVYTPKKDLFFKADGTAEEKNVLNRMIGFYLDTAIKKNPIPETVTCDGTDDISIQIPFVKTMHTSTGKHYLIVASKISYAPMSLFPIATSGGTMVLNIQDGIYALPLVPNDKGLTTSPFPDACGVIAKVDVDGVVELVDAGTDKGKYLYPTEFAHMPTKAQAPANVCGDGWITDISHVYDISVVGDTVYIAFGGGLEPWNKGIYATTAFFNKDGFIRGWTPIKRVMGSVIHAYGLGLDANRGNFYFLGPKAGSSTDTLPTTGYITQWGTSHTGVSTNTAVINSDTSIDDPTSLSTVLEKMFPSDRGGVYRTATFDEWTPGFDINGKFSMMIAVGYDKIALIETGGMTNGFFMPTEKFTTKDILNTDGTVAVAKNVFECSDKKLKDIAPLYCATVACDSTDPDNKHAYVFVGGYGGFVKADLDVNFSNLIAPNFDAPIISESVLSLLPGKAGGVDIVCALTNKKVYAYNVETNNQVNDLPVPGAIDFVVARKSDNKHSVIIVGTTSGIKAFDTDDTKVAPVLDNNIPGQVVQLQYLSQDQVTYEVVPGAVPTKMDTVYSTPSTPGMVYAWVLGKKIEEEIVVSPGETFDPSKTYPVKHVRKDVTVPQLYRFAVDVDGKLAAIDTFTDDKIFAGNTSVKDLLTGARPVLQLDTFRSGFFTDGSSVYYTASKSIDNADFARVFPLSYTKTFTNNPTVADDLSLMYNLALDDSSYYIGRGGIEPASGKKYFCGDFGIRVNE